MWSVAWFYKFAPKDIWDMLIDELMFWEAGILEVSPLVDNIHG